jgi:hypothetical protein
VQATESTGRAGFRFRKFSFCYRVARFVWLIADG